MQSLAAAEHLQEEEQIIVFSDSESPSPPVHRAPLSAAHVSKESEDIPPMAAAVDASIPVPVSPPALGYISQDEISVSTDVSQDLMVYAARTAPALASVYIPGPRSSTALQNTKPLVAPALARKSPPPAEDLVTSPNSQEVRQPTLRRKPLPSDATSLRVRTPEAAAAFEATATLSPNEADLRDLETLRKENNLLKGQRKALASALRSSTTMLEALTRPAGGGDSTARTPGPSSASSPLRVSTDGAARRWQSPDAGSAARRLDRGGVPHPYPPGSIAVASSGSPHHVHHPVVLLSPVQLNHAAKDVSSRSPSSPRTLSPARAVPPTHPAAPDAAHRAHRTGPDAAHRAHRTGRGDRASKPAAQRRQRATSPRTVSPKKATQYAALHQQRGTTPSRPLSVLTGNRTTGRSPATRTVPVASLSRYTPGDIEEYFMTKLHDQQHSALSVVPSHASSSWLGDSAFVESMVAASEIAAAVERLCGNAEAVAASVIVRTGSDSLRVMEPVATPVLTTTRSAAKLERGERLMTKAPPAFENVYTQEDTLHDKKQDDLPAPISDLVNWWTRTQRENVSSREVHNPLDGDGRDVSQTNQSAAYCVSCLRSDLDTGAEDALIKPSRLVVSDRQRAHSPPPATQHIFRPMHIPGIVPDSSDADSNVSPEQPPWAMQPGSVSHQRIHRPSPRPQMVPSLGYAPGAHNVSVPRSTFVTTRVSPHQPLTSTAVPVKRKRRRRSGSATAPLRSYSPKAALHCHAVSGEPRAPWIDVLRVRREREPRRSHSCQSRGFASHSEARARARACHYKNATHRGPSPSSSAAKKAPCHTPSVPWRGPRWSPPRRSSPSRDLSPCHHSEKCLDDTCVTRDETDNPKWQPNAHPLS